MAKAGRKRKDGARTPGGRLRQAWDYGCDGVQRRRHKHALVTANDDGKVKVIVDQSWDALGRAWAAGLLDTPGYDAAALRDAGRALRDLYWRHFQGGTRDSLARFMPKAGSSAGDMDDALEHALMRRLRAVEAKGYPVRRAIDEIVIGMGLEQDEGPPWLDRLIAARRSGQDGSNDDRARWALVRAGLKVLA